MLRSLKDLFGYTILAEDGTIGQVDDFYLDQRVWAVRYLVVDIGTWLPGRKVLISPLALGRPDWETQLFPIKLTKQQVERSPDISLEAPISRQQELDLHTYYKWSPYWEEVTPLDAGMAGIAGDDYLEAMRSAEAAHQMPPGQVESQLRSVDELTGYQVQALDGEVGGVADLLGEDDSWFVRYMVVETGGWLSGRQVLISPQWTERISWTESRIVVGLPQETIKNSPAYDPAAPVNREYEMRLYDFYGRPKYWR